MSGGKTNAHASRVESLEERQWQLKLEEIRKREADEEREWETLLTRAKAAVRNEELRAQRNAAREQAHSSGSFPRAQEIKASVPPPLPQRGVRRG